MAVWRERCHYIEDANAKIPKTTKYRLNINAGENDITSDDDTDGELDEHWRELIQRNDVTDSEISDSTISSNEEMSNTTSRSNEDDQQSLLYGSGINQPLSDAEQGRLQSPNVSSASAETERANGVNNNNNINTNHLSQTLSSSSSSSS
ncbi:hypothetical protein TSAR_016440 [Trichomalopsis sarcophagae]|uniref:Uncharacterized protein n=1 Tax=Trichomalopsis sarcophagae TaxID=543379 RepID=A0A232EI99_9HYME|nr:hypothetical protein TSAR_016440 [Trichomalopsis sarcophagae]